MMAERLFALILLVGLLFPKFTTGQQVEERTRYVQIGKGWARTSVNAAIFRQNSVVTHKETQTQYTAYYDADSTLVLANRKLGSSEWTLQETTYTGDVRDAHNSISIAVDGDGFLHVAWNHHNNTLNYVRSTKPGVLSLTSRLEMTGNFEDAVTYPQFYLLDDGDLLFLYRDGSSGNGNVMLNRYDTERKEWKAVAHPLIDGEGERNAYVNTLAIDRSGTWHLSWTWRETWDVATNHDILYARSSDEGETWENSNGDPYNLPITAENAEIVRHIPQKSELINQTSMTVTRNGEPVIASYWKPEGGTTPQFYIVWQNGNEWKSRQVSERTQPFSLSGGGTKRIPISRPQILAGDRNDLYLVYRDFERGGGIYVAVSDDAEHEEWDLKEIYASPIGLWEPTYDPVVWKEKNELHLFGQRVGQGDGETMEDMEPQEVFILEWTPSLYENN